jgi:hypothetical protein
MSALFVVFLLVGCYGPIAIPYTTPDTEYIFYQAQVDPNQESTRVIQKEGFETYGSRIDIVELTNSRFKMLVYYDDPFLEMRLIVPAGEELIIEEESIAIIFDTATQQEITTVDLDWQITSEANTKIEDNTEKFDVSGTYRSDIIGSGYWSLGKRPAKKVILKQNQDKIIGTFLGSRSGEIDGILNGDTIKFKWFVTEGPTGGESGRGEWGLTNDGVKWNGTGRSSRGTQGNWNLTKTSVSSLDNGSVSTEVKSQTTDSAKLGSSQSSSESSQSGVGENSQPAINYIELAPSLRATTYHTASHLFVNKQLAEEISLKLPLFRTKGNESIKFNDVTFKIFTRTEYKLHTFPYN